MALVSVNVAGFVVICAVKKARSCLLFTCSCFQLGLGK